jgi:hypothetical protein
MKLIPLLLALSASAALAQTAARPVLKNLSDNTLTEALATGAKTLTISAAGTLVWEDGATFTGASFFRIAAGLEIDADVQAWDATLDTLSSATAAGLALMDDADASAQRTTLGLGAAALLSTSTGGASGDAGKAVVFGSGGLITALGLTVPQDGGGFPKVVYGGEDIYFRQDASLSGTLGYATLTAGRLWALPDADGTVITTGNLSAITATGTVTSGTWSGSFGAVSGANLTSLNASNLASGTVPTARLGSGTADSTTYLRGDNTWQTVTAGIAGATGATDNAVLRADGSGGTTLQSSTMLISDNGNVLVQGVAAFSDPMVQVGATNTGLASIGSNRIDLVLGGLGHVGFSQSGWASFYGHVGVATPVLNFDVYTLAGPNLSSPTISGARWLTVTNAATAQVLAVSNTYTSGTNHEVAVLDWQTTTNTLRIGSDIGSAGGTARDVQLIRGGSVKATLGASTTDHAQPVKAAVYTVATLPAAATVGAYSIAAVSDADTPVVGSTVTGGGSAKALVCSNGTNWLVIAVL